MKNWFSSALLSAFFILSLAFTACNPDTTPGPPQMPDLDTSQWVVDTNRYYSLFNTVSATSQGVILSGASLNTTNGFGQSSFTITFHLPYIPAQGDYTIDCGNSGSSAACVDIVFEKLHYRPKAGTSVQLHADSLHGKAMIFLPPTWFYSTLPLETDSVVVSGTFFHQTYY